MQIDVKGRHLTVTAELRDYARKRFDKVSRQVSELAQMEVELCEERNPSNPDKHVVDVTLHLKGVTLRARERSPRDMRHAIHLAEEDISRQVKRHRDKRRRRREARSAAFGGGASPAL